MWVCDHDCDDVLHLSLCVDVYVCVCDVQPPEQYSILASDSIILLVLVGPAPRAATSGTNTRAGVVMFRSYRISSVWEY